MERKKIESYLQELFGPKAESIYVKYYNMWSDDINSGLHSCEERLGGHDKITIAQNHFCYFSSRLAATPKFVKNLRNAAETECKNKESCKNKLIAAARSHELEMISVRSEVIKYQNLMKKEGTTGKRILAGPKFRQKKR